MKETKETFGKKVITGEYAGDVGQALSHCQNAGSKFLEC